MSITREQIISALGHQKSLPSIPDLVLRLEAELRKNEPSFNDIMMLIEQDPALSLRILSVANSAFYSRGKAASSVKQAMLRLGFSELRRLAVTVVLVDNYKDFCGGSPKLFWGHSLAVGFAAKAVSEFCSVSFSDDSVETAFTCGLLHDLGVMAFGQLYPTEYQTMTARVLGRGGELSTAEQETFGIDHGEVGAILMRKWEVPDVICDVVEHHHHPWTSNPNDSDLKQLVQLIHLSDFVCNNQGFGRRRQLLPTSFDDTAWDSLGLSLDSVPDIIDKVRIEGERSQVFVEAFG